jgi:hypothetical protein
MKLKLQLLNAFLTFGLLFLCQMGYSQINYSEDFEDPDNLIWTNPEGFYYIDDYESCTDYSIVGELYTYYGAGTTVSSSIGYSNGQLATLTYQYKLVDYYDETEAYPNSPAWGNFTIEYATSQAGPWTLIETVSPTNHIVSASCATRTVTFTPPGGNNIYFRLTSTPNPDEDLEIDALLYFDNVAVTQAASLPCNGTPAASATVAASALLCSAQSASLSLSPGYFTTGLTYQWQSSADGVTYTNVATGGTATTYTTAQTSSTWYRAIITCTASTLTATSTPMHVVNSGLNCLCDVEFDGGVEPISLVEFAGINNPSSPAVGGSPGVENFTGVAPAQVNLGETYEITIEGNTNDYFEDGYQNFVTVFFDWNHDGDLTDDGESYEIGYLINSNGADGVQLTGDIEVPEDALPGLTYMRVFKLYDSYTSDPCSSEDGYGYGQIEDYVVNVNCNIEAPELDITELITCGSATGADLPVDEDIIWYASATGEDLVEDDTVLVSGTYYAAEVDGACESTERTEFTVTITVVGAIEGQTMQDLGDASGTTSDIVITAPQGATVVWYFSEADAQAGVNPIAADTVLEDQATYYGVPSIGECTGPVFAVTISNTGAVNGFASGSFKYYPNPVNSVLNLSYTGTITSVGVYNLLGQQVLAKTVNQNDAQIDLSSLSQGTYLVKVNSDNAATTIKVVKQ